MMNMKGECYVIKKEVNTKERQENLSTLYYQYC